MKLPDARRACYRLVALKFNDMVINTYEIQQIHVIFYWVTEYKPRCYQYVIIASYAHLHVTG